MVVEPGVKAEVNVTKWFRLSPGVSYRAAYAANQVDDLRNDGCSGGPSIFQPNSGNSRLAEMNPLGYNDGVGKKFFHRHKILLCIDAVDVFASPHAEIRLHKLNIGIKTVQ